MQKKPWIIQWMEYFLAFMGFAIFLMYMFYRPVQVSRYAASYENDTDEAIKEKLVWNTEYEESLEKLIIHNLKMLPENILSKWLDADSSIVICPNIKGYLDMDNEVKMENNTYTAAYNLIATDKNGVISSDIYILGSAQVIDSSLLHEIGHYVHDAYFDTDYVLPGYETDSKKFIESECNNFEYYAVPDEYFAEIFAYTVINGENENYTDTHDMEEIIENF